jgi:hypothetical protein
MLGRVERLEEVRQNVIGDAGPGVRHGQADIGVSLGSVAQRFGQQIGGGFGRIQRNTASVPAASCALSRRLRRQRKI